MSRWRQLIRISPYQFRLISPDPLLKALIGQNITTSLIYSLSRYMYRWRLFCVLLRNYGSSLTLHSMINEFTCYNCSLIRGSEGGDGLSRLASTSLKNFRITKQHNQPWVIIGFLISWPHFYPVALFLIRIMGLNKVKKPFFMSCLVGYDYILIYLFISFCSFIHYYLILIRLRIRVQSWQKPHIRAFLRNKGIWKQEQLDLPTIFTTKCLVIDECGHVRGCYLSDPARRQFCTKLLLMVFLTCA